MATIIICVVSALYMDFTEKMSREQRFLHIQKRAELVLPQFVIISIVLKTVNIYLYNLFFQLISVLFWMSNLLFGIEIVLKWRWDFHLSGRARILFNIQLSVLQLQVWNVFYPPALVVIHTELNINSIVNLLTLLNKSVFISIIKQRVFVIIICLF